MMPSVLFFLMAVVTVLPLAAWAVLLRERALFLERETERRFVSNNPGLARRAERWAKMFRANLRSSRRDLRSAERRLQADARRFQRKLGAVRHKDAVDLWIRYGP